jgi:hypothetical protein
MGFAFMLVMPGLSTGTYERDAGHMAAQAADVAARFVAGGVEVCVATGWWLRLAP